MHCIILYNNEIRNLHFRIKCYVTQRVIETITHFFYSSKYWFTIYVIQILEKCMHTCILCSKINRTLHSYFCANQLQYGGDSVSIQSIEGIYDASCSRAVLGTVIRLIIHCSYCWYMRNQCTGIVPYHSTTVAHDSDTNSVSSYSVVTRSQFATIRFSRWQFQRDANANRNYSISQ